MITAIPLVGVRAPGHGSTSLSVYPEADLALVENLPALAATRGSVVGVHMAVASSFLPRARSAAALVGEPFPSEFERAALGFFERELGARIPSAE